jgi:hypothetical protein
MLERLRVVSLLFVTETSSVRPQPAPQRSLSSIQVFRRLGITYGQLCQGSYCSRFRKFAR